MLINLISGSTEMEFINSGNTENDIITMLDPNLINTKFNFITGKNIDFRLFNLNEFVYINVGEIVTAEEVNDIINNR